MQGYIQLVIRMALYPIFGALAGAGFVAFDDATGDVALNLEQLATVLAGFVGVGLTWLWSRVAKRKGLAT